MGSHGWELVADLSNLDMQLINIKTELCVHGLIGVGDLPHTQKRTLPGKGEWKFYDNWT